MHGMLAMKNHKNIYVHVYLRASTHLNIVLLSQSAQTYWYFGTLHNSFNNRNITESDTFYKRDGKLNISRACLL